MFRKRRINDNIDRSYEFFVCQYHEQCYDNKLRFLFFFQKPISRYKITVYQFVINIFERKKLYRIFAWFGVLIKFPYFFSVHFTYVAKMSFCLNWHFELLNFTMKGFMLDLLKPISFCTPGGFAVLRAY